MDDTKPAGAAPAYPSPTERVKAWRDGAALHIRFDNPAKHNALSVGRSA